MASRVDQTALARADLTPSPGPRHAFPLPPAMPAQANVTASPGPRHYFPPPPVLPPSIIPPELAARQRVPDHGRTELTTELEEVAEEAPWQNVSLANIPGGPTRRLWPAILAYTLTGSLVAIIGIADVVHLMRQRADVAAASEPLAAAAMLTPTDLGDVLAGPAQPTDERPAQASGSPSVAPSAAPKVVPSVPAQPQSKPLVARRPNGYAHVAPGRVAQHGAPSRPARPGQPGTRRGLKDAQHGSGSNHAVATHRRSEWVNLNGHWFRADAEPWQALASKR